MTGHPIPADALEKHIAILGKTGSGKSNLAKTVAEDLLARDQRVCVIDPTGTWWGLRLMADGETPSGHPIVIFGGQHADLPIAAAHGETIARAIGTSSTPALIDTRQLNVSERTRFFTGFAETLIQANRGELTLIIDEAHVFMPQAGARAGGAAPAMLHAGNNLVSLGRGIGLRIILISQRPAKLHKDSLTQVETLVAMRLLAAQDRRAINDWIGEWADAHENKGLAASLPDLQTGEAWVWSPEIGHLERSRCPLASTYDSGRVRDRETPDLPPIDVAAIATRLEDIGSDLLADDPKRLRRRIAELERELKKAGAGGVDEAEAKKRAQAEMKAAIDRACHVLACAGTTFSEAVDRATNELQSGIDKAAAIVAGTAPEAPRQPSEAHSKGPEAHSSPPRSPSRRPTSPSDPSEPGTGRARSPSLTPRKHPSKNESSDLTGPQQRILDALAWLASLGIAERASRIQVAFLAKYKPGGGAFNNTLGSLRSAGLIEYPSAGEVTLTEDGRSRAQEWGYPLTNEALHEAVMARLTGPQKRVLQPLIDRYPLDMGCDELAQEAGYEAKGGAFNNTRGSLRSLGLIDYPAPGRVAALDVLFVGAARP